MALKGRLRVGDVSHSEDNKHIYVGWYDGSTRDLTQRDLVKLTNDLNDVEWMLHHMSKLRDTVKQMIVTRRSLGEALPGEEKSKPAAPAEEPAAPTEEAAK